MSLVIVAQIRAAAGKAEQLEAELRTLVAATVVEDGCDTYALHRSLEDPNLFHFHEIWRDRPAWDAHMEAPHLKAFGAKRDDLVESIALFQLEQIA
jgi:quinol monooxygenase YgiN